MSSLGLYMQATNHSAKQLGFKASCWNTINSLSYDRTPERTQGSMEKTRL